MVSRAEAILLWASNLWALGVGMFAPLYAVYAERVGGDIFELSWVYAVFLVVTGFGVVVMGKVADHFDRGRLVVMGNVLGVVATFGYILVSSMTGLLIVQVLFGLSKAISEPSWYALYDRFSGDGNHDGYLWGLSSGLYYVFQGIAILIGGYIVAQYSFEALFITMGIVLILSTLLQARILRYTVQ